MRPIDAIERTALLIALSLAAMTGYAATAADCGSATRSIGIFGAMEHPPEAAVVVPEIRALLPGAQSVQRVKDTHLAPSGERVVLYDSSADETDPHPKLAFVARGAVVSTIDVTSVITSDASFAASCEFVLDQGQRALAVAYTFSGDGTGSAFLIVTWETGVYRVIFHREVGQARIEISPREMKLWDATRGKYSSRADSANFECEWCKHRYLITRFEWKAGKFVRTGSKKTRDWFDPAEISGTPIIVRQDISRVR